MTHFISNPQRMFCLYLFLLCSIFTVNTIHAEEIIYASDPQNKRPIWISDVNGRNARQLFNPPLLVKEISIQSGDRYILCVAQGIDQETGVDAYIFDTEQLDKGRKDLTYGRFSIVSDAAISSSGDVVFSNTIYREYPDGIYLIPKHEVHEPIPEAIKLFSGPADYVDWSPNGKEVVFSNKEGIFLLDVFSMEVSQILEYGYRPVFSPDGTKLAFRIKTQQNDGKLYSEIGVISIQDPQNVNVFEKTKFHPYVNLLTWTPDGRSIAYVVTKVEKRKQGNVSEYLNFAVSVEDGKTQRIFMNFERGVRVWEWTKESFPLSPVAKLTTTWGKLKRDTGNGGQNE